MITHYLDLEVETKGIQKDMHFYITNIGKEDIFLRYPWLAAYEPCFIWKEATIGEEALPVIICSINPTIPCLQPTIVQTTLEDLKVCILQQLEEQCSLCTTSTNLRIQAGQSTKAVELPPQYKKFTKVVSEEDSQHFPPSRPWDHMIKLKKDAPDAIDCKVYPMSQMEDTALKEFLRSNCRKGTSVPQSLSMHHHSSLSPRRMENYALYRTIDVSMTTPFAISICFPSYRTHLWTFREHTFIQSWTFKGDTTMYI